jgi:hypothetical protein
MINGMSPVSSMPLSRGNRAFVSYRKCISVGIDGILRKQKKKDKSKNPGEAVAWKK